MPVFLAPEDEVIQEEVDLLSSTGGRKPETLQKRLLIVRILENYLEQTECKYRTLAELVEDKVELENILCTFFCAYRVGNDVRLPKKNTVMNCRSHLKCEISKLSESKVDIQNKDAFPKFHVSTHEIIVFIHFLILVPHKEITWPIKTLLGPTSIWKLSFFDNLEIFRFLGLFRWSTCKIERRRLRKYQAPRWDWWRFKTWDRRLARPFSENHGSKKGNKKLPRSGQSAPQTVGKPVSLLAPMGGTVYSDAAHR